MGDDALDLLVGDLLQELGREGDGLAVGGHRAEGVLGTGLGLDQAEVHGQRAEERLLHEQMDASADHALHRGEVRHWMLLLEKG